MEIGRSFVLIAEMQRDHTERVGCVCVCGVMTVVCVMCEVCVCVSVCVVWCRDSPPHTAHARSSVSLRNVVLHLKNTL